MSRDITQPNADKENDRKRGTAEHDRLFRVKPLMDTICHAFKDICHPRRNFAVDERMVACKTNTGMTQHMKAKPARCAFKFFLHSHQMDTVWTFQCTQERASPWIGLYNCLYMNNFNTHSKLLTDLFVMKFCACGTYMDSRRVCPQNADNSLMKKSARGSIRSRFRMGLLCL